MGTVLLIISKVNFAILFFEGKQACIVWDAEKVFSELCKT